MFLWHFLENDVGGQLFIFYLLFFDAVKTKYLSHFPKFLTFTMHNNQSANKLVANDGQLKLTIHDV